MDGWLNDTSVDGFLGNLRNPENFIKMNSKWNTSQMSDTSKLPSEEDGGTIVEDPVGLLNIYEYSMCGDSESYLNNGLYWWTLTPYNSSTIYYVIYTGSIGTTGVGSLFGIRPAINIKPEIKIVGGDGSEENPYRLIGDNDSSLEGVKLNTRYSGEYISFGTGENDLYRIVSHETEGLTKITSAYLLKENGTFKSLAFGDTVYYSNDNIIGSFLNGEYLDSVKYLNSEQVNMIEDNTAWYLGMVGERASYRLAKYKNTDMTEYATSTNAKVGLLRLGELMAGQFNFRGNSNYWSLTPFDMNGVRNVTSFGYLNNEIPSNSNGIKPALNLKSNVVITSGDGTLQNPFQIALAS